jgi:ribosome-binding factor A
MPSLRLERVRELLKREIGEIIRREIPISEVGLITVIDVQVSNDLHNAKVYCGILGNQAQKTRAIAELNQHRKHIQSLVGKAVILKYTPQLRFVVDESVEQGNKILKIIDELEHAASPDETTPKNN